MPFPPAFWRHLLQEMIRFQRHDGRPRGVVHYSAVIEHAWHHLFGLPWYSPPTSPPSMCWSFRCANAAVGGSGGGGGGGGAVDVAAMHAMDMGMGAKMKKEEEERLRRALEAGAVETLWDPSLTVDPYGYEPAAAPLPECPLSLLAPNYTLNSYADLTHDESQPPNDWFGFVWQSRPSGGGRAVGGWSYVPLGLVQADHRLTMAVDAASRTGMGKSGGVGVPSVRDLLPDELFEEGYDYAGAGMYGPGLDWRLPPPPADWGLTDRPRQPARVRPPASAHSAMGPFGWGPAPAQSGVTLSDRSLTLFPLSALPDWVKSLVPRLPESVDADDLNWPSAANAPPP
jgi:hypothetical protein